MWLVVIIFYEEYDGVVGDEGGKMVVEFGGKSYGCFFVVGN